ncbi:MAG: FGGY family carbohydrate kinase [Gemmataceae bacterium]
MAVILGLDLGTTTITGVALNTVSGEQIGCASLANRAARPADPGRSEWDVERMLSLAVDCLRDLASQCGAGRELVGLGITGQQHGMVLLDGAGQPLGPFVNWQDRRTEEPMPGTSGSYLDEARRRLGEVREQTGCRLSAGYLAATLFWLAQQGQLPEKATACFLMDHVAAVLTATRPVTDATCAASAGVFDLQRGDWAFDLLEGLGLPRTAVPPVHPSGAQVGRLTALLARATGLPEGLPVFGGIGDNQASFLGSVAHPEESLLVNVGTGGQVAGWSAVPESDPQLETRPFPLGGVLLVSAGLVGGAAYAQLEQFFRAVLRDLGGDAGAEIYARMNQLAAAIPEGCDGLTCEPFFAGTRLEPTRRAAWTGLGRDNFTPGHLARALLEGMARTLAASGQRIESHLSRPTSRLVGAGNGLRANELLCDIVARAFGRPLQLSSRPEEAARGAARLAAVRAGCYPDLSAAACLC